MCRYIVGGIEPEYFKVCVCVGGGGGVGGWVGGGLFSKLVHLWLSFVF